MRGLQQHIAVTIPTPSGPRPDLAATQRMAGDAVTEMAARRAEREALDGPSRSVYRQGGQPGERLENHEHAEGARKPRHPPHPLGVLLAQPLEAISSGGEPAERVGPRLGRGLLIQRAVELARVDCELQAPGREQDRGGEEPKHECCERDPAERMQPMCADRSGPQEGRHKRVCREQRACPLPDAGDEGLLICERSATRLVCDLLRGLLEDFGSFWELESEPAERRKLLLSLFQQVWAKDGRIVAVQPHDAFLPYFHAVDQTQQSRWGKFGAEGGSDGTRTRDLCRDRAAL